MEVNNCIFFKMVKAAQTAKAFWGEKVAPLNITASQALVLLILGEEDKVPAHVLVEKMGITSATVTGLLDRLQNLELIKRLPNPEDGRAILVCLRERGRILSDELRKIGDDANLEFLAAFSPEEQFMFHGLLHRCVG